MEEAKFDEDLDLDLVFGDQTFNARGSSRHIYEVWSLSILGAITVGMSGLFPLLVLPIDTGPVLKSGGPGNKLRLMLSFAVGSLLGDVFLHLLPEVWAHRSGGDQANHTKTGLWVICGLLAFMIIEKLLGDEKDLDQEASETMSDSSKKTELRTENSVPSTVKTSTFGAPQEQNRQRKYKNYKPMHKLAADDNKRHNRLHQSHPDKLHNVPSSICDKSNNNSKGTIKISGYLNLLANVVDNFTHGLAVAGSFCVSTKVGLVTTIAILLHEIPHEVGDFAILLNCGFSRWKAAQAQFITAAGGVVGAVTALITESARVAGERTVWILPFTSGGFLYIALVTVLPDLLDEKHGWESLKQFGCLCLGVLCVASVTVAFD